MSDYILLLWKEWVFADLAGCQLSLLPWKVEKLVRFEKKSINNISNSRMFNIDFHPNLKKQKSHESPFLSISPLGNCPFFWHSESHGELVLSWCILHLRRGCGWNEFQEPEGPFHSKSCTSYIRQTASVQDPERIPKKICCILPFKPQKEMKYPPEV